MSKKIELKSLVKQNFLDYSYEVNSNRAIPDARDGLKPGARCCLWDMFRHGWLSNKPHVKSAKIAGSVIGSLWPHGDVAVYETFVRMSQPWVNNIPEVDWHGANGSQMIEDGHASMRYTEARLAKAAEEGMMFGIKKENVPMILNFTEDEEMPSVLPAIMPRLMVNGTKGIGVSMATTWLPHNLLELEQVIDKYAKESVLDCSGLKPDFPSGGVIINSNSLSKIYETGRGTVYLRGATEIKDRSIFITELPYQVYVETLIDEIKTLVDKGELSGIEDIINRSGKKKLIIEVVCEGEPQKVLDQLFDKTDLQKSYSANQVALIGKTPKLLTMKEYLDVYLQHNYDCIQREFEFDLKKAKARANIVQGLLTALEDIDNVISLIKGSENTAAAIENLMTKYALNEAQAKAITDMKLGRLAKLESIELGNELKELEQTINDCNVMINEEGKRKELFLERFRAFCKKYGAPRKTALDNIEIIKEKKATATKERKPEIAEDCIVVVTRSGKAQRLKNYSIATQKRAGKGAKTSDPNIAVIHTDTLSHVLFITNKGRYYSLKAKDISEGAFASIASIVSLADDEDILSVVAKGETEESLVFVTKYGVVKRLSTSEISDRTNKKGSSVIKLKDGDELAVALRATGPVLMIGTRDGQILSTNLDEFRETGKAAGGAKGIKLEEGDIVVSALTRNEKNTQIAIFATDGKGKLCSSEDFPVKGKNTKGIKGVGAEQFLAKILVVDNDDSITIVGEPSSISVLIQSAFTSVVGRSTQGLQMIKDSRIVDVVKA